MTSYHLKIAKDILGRKRRAEGGDIWDDSKIRRTGEGGQESPLDFIQNSPIYKERSNSTMPVTADTPPAIIQSVKQPQATPQAPSQPTQSQPAPVSGSGVYAVGTNDANPDVTIGSAKRIIDSSTAAGIKPVFLLPNQMGDTQYAKNSKALQKYLDDNQIQYHMPEYDEKDPLHIKPSWIKGFKGTYDSPLVAGDSNSVRLGTLGYGAKSPDSKTLVDPNSKATLGRVGANSKYVADELEKHLKWRKGDAEAKKAGGEVRKHFEEGGSTEGSPGHDASGGFGSGIGEGPSSGDMGSGGGDGNGGGGSDNSSVSEPIAEEKPVEEKPVEEKPPLLNFNFVKPDMGYLPVGSGSTFTPAAPPPVPSSYAVPPVQTLNKGGSVRRGYANEGAVSPMGDTYISDDKEEPRPAPDDDYNYVLSRLNGANRPEEKPESRGMTLPSPSAIDTIRPSDPQGPKDYTDKWSAQLADKLGMSNEGTRKLQEAAALPAEILGFSPAYRSGAAAGRGDYGEAALEGSMAALSALPFVGAGEKAAVGAAKDVLAAPRAVAKDVVAEKPIEAATRSLSPVGLYSHAAEMAEGLPQAKGTPEQMRAMLFDKYGVKPVELEGFEEKFAGRPSVTKEELAQHFRERMPQVEEKIIGRGMSSADSARLSELEQKNALEGLSQDETLEWQNLHRKESSDIFEGPKFGANTLPGGENYREVLLKYVESPEEKLDRRKSYVDPAVWRRMTDEQREQFLAAPDKGLYQSNHWDDPNVLAHIRMSDRTGPNGQKLLHVEELQSDWGQEGREPFKGFYDPKKPYQAFDGRTGKVLGNFETPKEAKSFIKSHPDKQFLTWEQGEGPVKAPYVTSTQGWTDLTLKRVLKEAAEGGYEGVVFTSGAEQAKRYDLSKSVSEIAYNPYTGYLRALGVNGKPAINKKVEPSKLSEIVGKEVAEKLLATKLSNLGDLGSWHSMETNNLQVGGEGMKGYYDKIVPTQLQKLVKGYDKDVKLGTMQTNSLPNMLHLPITDKMREHILKGQKAYMHGGHVGYADGGIIDKAMDVIRRK